MLAAHDRSSAAATLCRRSGQGGDFLVEARRLGCRSRIVKPEKCVDFQRLFMSGPGASRPKSAISLQNAVPGVDFGTTGELGGKKGCSRRAAECWPPTSCQFCSSVCPFQSSPKGPPRRLRGPRRGRTRTRRSRGVRRRRAAQATPRSGGARQVRRRTRTTVRSAGTVGFSTAEATSKTHAAGHVLPFVVPLAGKPVVLAGRRKPEPAITSRARAALSCSCAIAHDGAELFERLGGMTPSSGCASVDEGGQALESEGGGGHGPRSGNGRSGLLRRLAGFRFAPTGTGKRTGRPAGRSVARTALA